MAWAGLAGAQSVTLEQAVQRLHATLATIPHLNESDLLSDESGSRYAAARNFVLDRQCASRTANPLLAIAQPTGLSLRGALDSSQPPRVADSFELPLRVAALSEVPNEYLKDMVALMNARSLPAEVGAKLNKEIPETYKTLVARTSGLINDYDFAKCRPGTRQEVARGRVPFIFIAPTY